MLKLLTWLILICLTKGFSKPGLEGDGRYQTPRSQFRQDTINLTFMKGGFAFKVWEMVYQNTTAKNVSKNFLLYFFSNPQQQRVCVRGKDGKSIPKSKE